MKFVHICHVKIFQISPHDRCGEIGNLSTSVMKRYLRFLHMTDVENSEITPHVENFEILQKHRYFFSDLRCFVEIYTLLCGEKFTQKMLMWRKLQILGMFWGNCGITKFNLTSPLKPVWLWRRDILGEVKHKLHKLLSGWPDLHLGAAETILKACLTQWNVERQGILGEVNISVVDIDQNISEKTCPEANMQIFAFLGILLIIELSAKGFPFKLLVKVFFWLHPWQKITIARLWKGSSTLKTYLRYLHILQCWNIGNFAVKYWKYLFSTMHNHVPGFDIQRYLQTLELWSVRILRIFHKYLEIWKFNF